MNQECSSNDEIQLKIGLAKDHSLNGFPLTLEDITKPTPSSRQSAVDEGIQIPKLILPTRRIDTTKYWKQSVEALIKSIDTVDNDLGQKVDNNKTSHLHDKCQNIKIIMTQKKWTLPIITDGWEQRKNACHHLKASSKISDSKSIEQPQHPKIQSLSRSSPRHSSLYSPSTTNPCSFYQIGIATQDKLSFSSQKCHQRLRNTSQEAEELLNDLANYYHPTIITESGRRESQSKSNGNDHSSNSRKNPRRKSMACTTYFY